MKTTHTTTAALALALSVFLAHGAAAQSDTRSAGTPNPENTQSAPAQPMNDTANPAYDNGKLNPSTTSSTPISTTTGAAQTATGKVVTKNADSVVVLTDAGQRVTVYTDSTSTLPTSTWAVGDRVTVSYTTPSAGRNHADTIVIATAPTTGYDSATSTTAADNDLDTTSTQTSASTLPRTASNLPLTLLFGSFAGAAAAALHLARRSA